MNKHPKVGGYFAECCLLDTYRIDTQEQADELAERIDSGDTCPPMIFETLAEAIGCLADDHEPAEREEQFRRLGWSPAPRASSPPTAP